MVFKTEKEWHNLGRDLKNYETEGFHSNIFGNPDEI